MIVYNDCADKITAEMLTDFFKGWKKSPSAHKHLEILLNSDYRIVAIDEDKNKVAGFINAVTDNILSAYIPLLEVLPEYQHQGIGSGLVKRMLEKLKDFYMIDIVCDESLQKFYEKFGLQKHTAMIKRNYEKQNDK